MKKYDGLYIFAGNAKDDVLEASLTKAVAEIERFGGKVEAQEILGKRTFARPMHKRENVRLPRISCTSTLPPKRSISATAFVRLASRTSSFALPAKM